MKIIIEDKDLYEFLETGKSKKLKRYRNANWFKNGLERVLELMSIVQRVKELEKWSFLHFEKIKDNKSGYCSVRVHNGHVERLIFREEEDESGEMIAYVIVITELNTTHYGNKK